MKRIFGKALAFMLSVVFVLTLVLQAGIGVGTALADANLDFISNDIGDGSATPVATGSTSYVRVYTKDGLYDALYGSVGGTVYNITYIEFGNAIDNSTSPKDLSIRNKSGTLVINARGNEYLDANSGDTTTFQVDSTAGHNNNSLDKIVFRDFYMSSGKTNYGIVRVDHTSLKEVEFDGLTYVGPRVGIFPGGSEGANVVFNGTRNPINVTIQTNTGGHSADEFIQDGKVMYLVGTVNITKNNTSNEVFGDVAGIDIGRYPTTPAAAAFTTVASTVTVFDSSSLTNNTAPITVRADSEFTYTHTGADTNAGRVMTGGVMTSLTLENGAALTTNSRLNVNGPLSIGDNATLTSTAPYDYSLYGASALNVTIGAGGTYDAISSVYTGTNGSTTLGAGATLRVLRNAAATYSAYNTNNLTVGENATVDISTSHATGAATGTLSVRGDLVINNGATFRVVANTRTSARNALVLSGNMTVTTPQEFFIYNSGTTQAVGFANGKTVKLTLNNMSYWVDRQEEIPPDEMPVPDINWSGGGGTFTITSATTATGFSNATVSSGAVTGLRKNGNAVVNIALPTDITDYSWGGKYTISIGDTFVKVPYTVKYQIYDPINKTYTDIDFIGLGDGDTILNPITNTAMVNPINVSLSDMANNPALTAYYDMVAPIPLPDLSEHGLSLLPGTTANNFVVTDKTNQVFTVMYYHTSANLDPVTGTKNATRVGDNLWKIELSFEGESDEQVSQVNTDIVLVIDVSASMSNADGGVVRIDAVKAASKRMIDSLSTKASLTGTTRVGVVVFSANAYSATGAHIVTPLTPIKFGEHASGANVEQVKSDIDAITLGGGTYSWRGITLADQQMLYDTSTEGEPYENYNKYMILLSDGADANRSSGRTAAKAYRDKGGTLVTIGFATDQAYLNEIQNGGYYTADASSIDQVFDDIIGDMDTIASITEGTLTDPMGIAFELTSPDGTTFNPNTHVTIEAWNGSEDVSNDPDISLDYTAPNPPTTTVDTLTLNVNRVVSKVTLTYYVRLKNPDDNINEDQSTNGETVFEYTDSNGADSRLEYEVPSVDNAAMVLNLNYDGPQLSLPSTQEYKAAIYPDQTTRLTFDGPSTSIFKGQLSGITLQCIDAGNTTLVSYDTWAEFVTGQDIQTETGTNKYSIAAAQGNFILTYEYEWVEDTSTLYDYKVDGSGSPIAGGGTPAGEYWFAKTDANGPYSTSDVLVFNNDAAGLQRYLDASVDSNNYIFDSELTQANNTTTADTRVVISDGPTVTASFKYGISQDMRVYYALDSDRDGVPDYKQIKVGLAYYVTDANNTTTTSPVETAQYPLSGSHGGITGSAGAIDLSSAAFSTYAYGAQNYVYDADKTQANAGGNYTFSGSSLNFTYGTSLTIKLYYALDVVDANGAAGNDGIPDYKQRFTLYNDYKATDSSTLGTEITIGRTPLPGDVYNTSKTYTVAAGDLDKYNNTSVTGSNHKPYISASQPGTPEYTENYIFDSTLTQSNAPGGTNYSYNTADRRFTYYTGKDAEIKIIYALDSNNNGIADYKEGYVSVDHAFYVGVDGASSLLSRTADYVNIGASGITANPMNDVDRYYGTLNANVNFQFNGAQYKSLATDSSHPDSTTERPYVYNYIFDPVLTRSSNSGVTGGFSISDYLSSGLGTVQGNGTPAFKYTSATQDFTLCFSRDANDNGIPDYRDNNVTLTGNLVDLTGVPVVASTPNPLFNENQTDGTELQIIGTNSASPAPPIAGQRWFYLKAYEDLTTTAAAWTDAQVAAYENANNVIIQDKTAFYPNNYIFDDDYNLDASSGATEYTYHDETQNGPAYQVRYGSTSDVPVYYLADFDGDGKPDVNQIIVNVKDYLVDSDGTVATDPENSYRLFGDSGDTYTYGVDFNKYTGYVFDYIRTKNNRTATDYVFDITPSESGTSITYTSAVFNVVFGTTPDINLYWAEDANGNGIPDSYEKTAVIQFFKLDGEGVSLTNTTPFETQTLIGLDATAAKYTIPLTKYEVKTGSPPYPDNYVFDASATTDAWNNSTNYQVNTGATPPNLSFTFGSPDGLAMPLYYALDADGDGTPDYKNQKTIIEFHVVDDTGSVAAGQMYEYTSTESDPNYTLYNEVITGTYGVSDTYSFTSANARFTQFKNNTPGVDDVPTGSGYFPNNYVYDAELTELNNNATTFALFTPETDPADGGVFAFNHGQVTNNLKLYFSLDADNDGKPDRENKSVAVQDKLLDGSGAAVLPELQATTLTGTYNETDNYVIDKTAHVGTTTGPNHVAGKYTWYTDNYVFDAAKTAEEATASSNPYSYVEESSVSRFEFTFPQTSYTMNAYYALDVNNNGTPDYLDTWYNVVDYQQGADKSVAATPFTSPTDPNGKLNPQRQLLGAQSESMTLYLDTAALGYRNDTTTGATNDGYGNPLYPNNYIFDAALTKEWIDASSAFTYSTSAITWTAAARPADGSPIELRLYYSLDADGNGNPDYADGEVKYYFYKVDEKGYFEGAPVGTSTRDIDESYRIAADDQLIYGVDESAGAFNIAANASKYTGYTFDAEATRRANEGNTFFTMNLIGQTITYEFDAALKGTTAPVLNIVYAKGTTTPEWYDKTVTIEFYKLDGDGAGSGSAFETDSTSLKGYYGDAASYTADDSVGPPVGALKKYEDKVTGASQTGGVWTYPSNYIFDYDRTIAEATNSINNGGSVTNGFTSVTDNINTATAPVSGSMTYNFVYGDTTLPIKLYYGLDADGDGKIDYYNKGALVYEIRLDGHGNTASIVGNPETFTYSGTIGDPEEHPFSASKYAASNYIYDSVKTESQAGFGAAVDMGDFWFDSSGDFQFKFKTSPISFNIYYALDSNGNGTPDHYEVRVDVNHVLLDKTGAETTNAEHGITNPVTELMQPAGTTGAQYAIDPTLYNSTTETGTDGNNDPIYGNNFMFDATKTQAYIAQTNTAGVVGLALDNSTPAAPKLTFAYGTQQTTNPILYVVYSIDANNNGTPDWNDKDFNIYEIKTAPGETDVTAATIFRSEEDGTTQALDSTVAAAHADYYDYTKHENHTATGTDGNGNPVYANNYIFDYAKTAAWINALDASKGISIDGDYVAATGRYTWVKIIYTYGDHTELQIFFSLDADGNGIPDEYDEQVSISDVLTKRTDDAAGWAVDETRYTAVVSEFDGVERTLDSAVTGQTTADYKTNDWLDLDKYKDLDSVTDLGWTAAEIADFEAATGYAITDPATFYPNNYIFDLGLTTTQGALNNYTATGTYSSGAGSAATAASVTFTYGTATAVKLYFSPDFNNDGKVDTVQTFVNINHVLLNGSGTDVTSGDARVSNPMATPNGNDGENSGYTIDTALYEDKTGSAPYVNNYIFDPVQTAAQNASANSQAGISNFVFTKATPEFTFTFGARPATRPVLYVVYLLDSDGNDIPDLYDREVRIQDLLAIPADTSDGWQPVTTPADYGKTLTDVRIKGYVNTKRTLVSTITGTTDNGYVNTDWLDLGKYKDLTEYSGDANYTADAPYTRNFIFDLVLTKDQAGAPANTDITFDQDVEENGVVNWVKLTYKYVTDNHVKLYFSLDANNNGVPDSQEENVAVDDYKNTLYTPPTPPGPPTLAPSPSQQIVAGTTRIFSNALGETTVIGSDTSYTGKYLIDLDRYVNNGPADGYQTEGTGQWVYPNNYIFDAARTETQNPGADVVENPTTKAVTVGFEHGNGNSNQIGLVYSQDINGDGIIDDLDVEVTINYIKADKSDTAVSTETERIGGPETQTGTLEYPDPTVVAGNFKYNLNPNRYMDSSNNYANNYIFDYARTAAESGGAFTWTPTGTTGADQFKADAAIYTFTFSATTVMNLYYTPDFDGDGIPDKDQGTIEIRTYFINASGTVSAAPNQPYVSLKGVNGSAVDEGFGAGNYTVSALLYSKPSYTPNHMFDKAETETNNVGATISYTDQAGTDPLRVENITFEGLSFSTTTQILKVYFSLDADDNYIPDRLQSTSQIFDRKLNGDGKQTSQIAAGSVAGERSKPGTLIVDSTKYQDLITGAHQDPGTGKWYYPNNYTLDLDSEFGTMAANKALITGYTKNGEVYTFTFTYGAGAKTSDIILVWGLDTDNNGVPDYDQFTTPPVPNSPIWEGQRNLGGWGIPGATVYALLPRSWYGTAPAPEYTNLPPSSTEQPRPIISRANVYGSTVGTTHVEIVGQQYLLSTQVNTDGSFWLKVPNNTNLIHSQRVYFFQIEPDKDVSSSVVVYVFRDGEITDGSGLPNTDDTNRIPAALYAVLALAALMAMGYTVIRKKKEDRA